MCISRQLSINAADTHCPKRKEPPDKIVFNLNKWRVYRSKNGNRIIAMISVNLDKIENGNGIKTNIVYRQNVMNRNDKTIDYYNENHPKILKITHNKEAVINNGNETQKFKYNPPNGETIIEVAHQNDGWFITCPLLYNGKITEVQLFADAGADTAGVNEEYAIENYEDIIQITHKGLLVDTPNENFVSLLIF